MWDATVADAVTFTVTNTNPSGAGSLAQAITNANAASDLDTIEFAIAGGGVPTIVASLPAITQPVLIDGTTQPGAFVELRNPGSTALTINGNGSTVRGMVLNSSLTGVGLGPAAGGNTVTGCRIGTDVTGTAATANLVGVSIQNPSGGNNTITNNLISGNTQTGVSVFGNDNVVTGNVIGLDATQTDGVGGGTGILVNVGTGNRIGGTQPGEGNVIAGLAGNGLSLTNATVQNTLIRGNRIGTNGAGDAGLGMSVGVSIAAVAGTGNILGGAEPGAGNLIVAASSSGVSVLNSSNITIQGNTIGTIALPHASHGLDMAGADGNLLEDNVIGGNGGAGVNFRSGADDNTLRGNEITSNGGAGIAISGGQRDRFTENSIHDNGGLGIDLGVTGVNPNDPLDVDLAPGHNDAQNYPVLSTVSASQVTGSLNSTPNTAFSVEFFANVSCHASGNGEGGTFLGALQVMTDASGNTGDFVLPLAPGAAGRVISATATDPNGNTSEFSACTSPVPSGTTTTSTQPSTTSTTPGSTTTTSTTSPTSSTLPPTTTTVSSTTSTTGSSTTVTSSSTSISSTTSTTSSSSTTTTPASTTTSTTLAGDCGTEPVGPTFRSLNCRLADLIAAVQAETELGKQQAKLDKAAQKSRQRKDAAETACAEGNAKASAKQLRKVVRKLIQFSHRLRSKNARKHIPEEVREPLALTADVIQEDVRALQESLSCAG